MAFCARFAGVWWLGFAFAPVLHNVLPVYDVWRSGKAGLAQRLRLSANAVTKPNVPAGPSDERSEERSANWLLCAAGAPTFGPFESGAEKRRTGWGLFQLLPDKLILTFPFICPKDPGDPGPPSSM